MRSVARRIFQRLDNFEQGGKDKTWYITYLISKKLFFFIWRGGYGTIYVLIADQRACWGKLSIYEDVTATTDMKLIKNFWQSVSLDIWNNFQLLVVIFILYSIEVKMRFKSLSQKQVTKMTDLEKSANSRVSAEAEYLYYFDVNRPCRISIYPPHLLYTALHSIFGLFCLFLLDVFASCMFSKT